MDVEENYSMLFISSDKRDLYFEDVFRVMAAPKSYSIKFRYQNKWIENIDEVKKNDEIIICSLVGTKNDETDKMLELIPVRKAKIQETTCDSGLTMYYLELGNFVQLISNQKTKIMSSVPEKMVCTTIEDEKLKVRSCTWEEKVDELFSLQNDSFSNRLMYKVEKLEKKNIFGNWKDVPFKKKNTYVLQNDSDYQMTIKLKKKEEQREKVLLSISADKELIKNILKTFSLDAPRDIIKNDFYTGVLDKGNRYSRITFNNTPREYESQKDNKYDFKINIEFSRKKTTYLLFGILMGALTTFTKYNGIISFSKIINLMNSKGIFGILDYTLLPLSVCVISALLFYGYDKK